MIFIIIYYLILSVSLSLFFLYSFFPYMFYESGEMSCSGRPLSCIKSIRLCFLFFFKKKKILILISFIFKSSFNSNSKTVRTLPTTTHSPAQKKPNHPKTNSVQPVVPRRGFHGTRSGMWGRFRPIPESSSVSDRESLAFTGLLGKDGQR